MPDTDRSVAAVITVNDMYHELQGVRQDLNTLGTKLDTIPVQLSTLAAGHADHETTIRSLVSSVTTMRTQLRAAWAGIGVLLIALGVVAAFLADFH